MAAMASQHWMVVSRAEHSDMNLTSLQWMDIICLLGGGL